MADAHPLTPQEALRWAQIGALSALAMLLGYVETFVPLPLPGVKLGLANIPVLIALATGDITGALFVSLMKVLVTGLLFGNPVTLAYSLTGTLLAFCAMAPLSKLPTMRLEMVSVVGALAHEAGQLLVAQAILGTSLVWYGAPALAVAGCLTGALCGVVAQRTLLLLERADMDMAIAPTPAPDREPSQPVSASAVCMLAGYAALVLAVMHATSPLALVSCLALTIAACGIARVRSAAAGAALAPTVPLALVTLVAQIASAQQGTVLALLGPVAITREALTASGVMLARLVCISLASLAVVQLIGRAGLASLARALFRPLKALGARTEGPELAFSTTLSFIAQITERLSSTIDPHDVWTKAFWLEQLPTLVAELYHQVGRTHP